MSNKYHAHRVVSHIYEYRVCWEAVDKDGNGFAHAYTLREFKMWGR